MSFTIRPISAYIVKDTDTFSKMDPYVILKIGSKKYRSRTHHGGGKNPQWTDTFEVAATGDLLMKVEAWDKDIIKDDFLGEGYYDLRQLMNFPGNTQNQYVDLIKHGKSFGRVLISMSYHGPNPNQGFGLGYQQQPWGYQNQPFGYQNQPAWQNNPNNYNQNYDWNNPPKMMGKSPPVQNFNYPNQPPGGKQNVMPFSGGNIGGNKNEGSFWNPMSQGYKGPNPYQSK